MVIFPEDIRESVVSLIADACSEKLEWFVSQVGDFS